MCGICGVINANQENTIDKNTLEQMKEVISHRGPDGHLVVPTSQKHPPFWRSNMTMNQIWFSSLHMTKKNLALYIEKLERSSIVANDLADVQE